ncbi:hypothetical protein SGLAM104S_00606 [Streptomyces glaucescens]
MPPPRVLRVSTWSSMPISGPAAGSSSRCGGGDPAEPVADVAAGVADALDLGVLGVGVGDLEVAGLDLAAHLGRVEERLVGEAVHLLDELFEGGRGDEVGAVAQEGVHRTRGALAEDAFAQERGAGPWR